MTNKDRIERQCLDMTIKNCPQLRGFIIEKGERPDFILKSNSVKIGVEHFLVDTLVKEQTSKEGTSFGSMNRRFDREILSIYNRYKDGMIIGNEEKALSEIEALINKGCETVTTFDCTIFQQEFLRIVGEHAKNVDVYKSKGIDKLGFLCEVDVMSVNNVWDVCVNNVRRKQAINVPLTNAMWLMIKILLLLGFIDFFVITVMSTYKKNEAKSLYLTKDSDPFIVDDFAYLYQDVQRTCKLNLEKGKDDESTY